MVVGVLNVTLYIGGMNSLKEKRSVIKSMLTKIRTKFNVSAAETGMHDQWNKCEMGFSCVSNDSSHVESIISNIIRFIDFDPRVEITDSYCETIHI